MRLLVIDAHPSTRRRIKAIFSRSSEFEILAICPDTRSAFVMADSLDPDAFVIDPVLLDADGYAVIRTLRKCLPDRAVVVFSYPASAQAVLNAFQAGAQAFVLKTDPTEAIFEALRAVFRGECHVSEASLANLRRELLPDTEEEPFAPADGRPGPTLH